MEHQLSSNLPVILMHARDTVATSLRDLQPGEVLAVGERVIRVTQAIPFGHKVALTPIASGELVYKYGEVIGKAIREIRPGEHVHVHNIEGTRGRGDLAARERT